MPGPQEILQFTLTGLTIGAIYAVVALSFTIVYNATGVVNFAQGEFVMLGGLFVCSFSAMHVPLPVAAVLAIVCTSLVALAVHVLTIGRMRGAGTFSIIMVTLGIAIVIRTVAQFVWGTESRALNTVASTTSLNIFGATTTLQALWILLAGVALVSVLFAFFKYTRQGQAMLACSENREAAALVGISVGRTGLAAFILGGALGALAGILVAPITTVSYGVGLYFTLKGFAAAVLGGFGNPVGAIAGGLLLGLLETYGAGFISSGYQDLISLLALVVVLILRPRGIAGSRILA
jgi:branched-chain amino acid transport system permease protein